MCRGGELVGPRSARASCRGLAIAGPSWPSSSCAWAEWPCDGDIDLMMATWEVAIGELCGRMTWWPMGGWLTVHGLPWPHCLGVVVMEAWC